MAGWLAGSGGGGGGGGGGGERAPALVRPLGQRVSSDLLYTIYCYIILYYIILYYYIESLKGLAPPRKSPLQRAILLYYIILYSYIYYIILLYRRALCRALCGLSLRRVLPGRSIKSPLKSSPFRGALLGLISYYKQRDYIII